jgi:hypothetical protein
MWKIALHIHRGRSEPTWLNPQHPKSQKHAMPSPACHQFNHETKIPQLQLQQQQQQQQQQHSSSSQGCLNEFPSFLPHRALTQSSFTQKRNPPLQHTILLLTHGRRHHHHHHHPEEEERQRERENKCSDDGGWETLQTHYISYNCDGIPRVCISRLAEIR